MNSIGRQALVCVIVFCFPNWLAAQVNSTWNGTTGNWSDFTKWSTNPLFPNNGNGGNNYNATVNGGTVTLDQDISIEKLTIGGGTITGSSNLILNGLSSAWSAGTMSGSATTTIASSGSLAINGSAIHNLNRSLVNEGTVTWPSANVSMNSSTFQNNGTFTSSPTLTRTFFNSGGTTVFNNAGTFTKLNTGAAEFGVTFNNTGTVDVQAGTLRLEAGGTHSGDFDIDGGAMLELTGTHNFSTTAEITGTGTLAIPTGATIDGLTSMSGVTTNFSGGSIVGSDNLTIHSGSLVWSGGTMAGTGQTVIGSAGSMTINGGSIQDLHRSLVNEGAVTWTSASVRMNNSTFQNNGTFTSNSNTTRTIFSAGGTTVFNNAGTFTKLNTGATEFDVAGSGVAFNNTGTVDIQAGTLRLEAGGTHSGDFDIDGGATLELTGTHNFSTTAEITGSGALAIPTGATIDGLASISGVTTSFSGGSIVGSDNLTIHSGSLVWSDGTMSGSGTTTIGSAGSMTINGNVIHNLHRSLVNEGAVTWTSANVSMNNSTFQNNGTFTSSPSLTRTFFNSGGTTVFNNAGTFIKLNTGAAEFDVAGSGVAFNNTGTVDVQAGTLRLEAGGTHSGDFDIASSAVLRLNGIHSFAATSDVTGSGTVHVDGGTTTFNGQLAGSTVTISSDAVLKGSGTFQTNLTNLGRLAPGNSPGIITIDGDFTQTSTSSLEIEVGGLNPGTEHDQVIVSGHASLDGRFEFPIINNFVPQLNDEITFLTANSITGTPRSLFAPNLGSISPDLSFVVIKNSQDLRLRFVAPTDVHFVDNSAQVQDWNEAANWSISSVPGTSDRVELTRSDAPSIERVEVTSVDAVAHAVSIHDQSSPIIIAVKNDTTLATAVGNITIGENATIELGTPGNPLDVGTLATPSSGSVVLEDGGLLKGNGIVTGGELVVSQGTISPGFSVGHLEIDGDVQLSQSANVVIELDSLTSTDTIDITGTVNLGGTLSVTVDSSIQVGDSFAIITAADLLGTAFDDLDVTGTSNFFLALEYESDLVSLITFNTGDMNRSGDESPTEDDVPAFALALTNPSKYFDDFGASSDNAGDIDGDGDCDVDDIDNFANLMGMPLAELQYRMQLAISVPEPGGIILLVCAVAIASMRRSDTHYRN
jgi:hypothetical protein